MSMRTTVGGWLVVIGVSLALSVSAYAQEATVSGTVTDSTGGVLPGVSVTALHEASGNTFVAVTDERGAFRLPVRTGTYRITVELPGFATLTRSLELLVGQTAVVNLQMVPSTVQESVTVTGEAPLIDVTSSTVSSNITPRQMQELPVNGRNWIDLTLLAPGMRQNAVSEIPSTGNGSFELNVDGQQVTQRVAVGFGQPRFSKDAIAEFEFIANRFDARQGRSVGVQVNAITKSGTNTPAGTLSGYFRDDNFVAKDFIQQRVLPYQNQQLSATYGGPIRKDKVHFFASYEYEREPRTFSHSSPWPSFNIDQTGTRTEKKGGVRLDAQFSPQTRLSVRGNKSRVLDPYDPRWSGGAIRHPSSGIRNDRRSNNLIVALTQVLGNRAVNEVRAGYAGYWWELTPIVVWPNHPNKLKNGAPIIQLRGYTIGQGHMNSYQLISQEPYSIRDDFTYSFTKRGRHDLKVGGEYIYAQNPVFHCTRCMGLLDAQGGPPPANLEQLFPVWNDISTWNLAGLSPIARFYQLPVGRFKIYGPEHMAAGWVQDDWAITPRLTLNLGLRYDIHKGMYAEYASVEPFLEAGRPLDKNNVGPRLGFAYSLTARTVLRGGFGRFFGDAGNDPAHWTNLWAGQIHLQVLNDGRPDFAANPFNGPIPTYDQALASWRRGEFVRAITALLPPPNAQMPYSYQSSIGVQRQMGSTMSIEADYVSTRFRHSPTSQNINLAYDPATGANYPFEDLTRKPYAGWNQVQMNLTEGQSNYHALQMGFTKRMSHRWQASATYLLSGQWNLQRAPINPGCRYPMTIPSPGEFRCDIPIQLHPVLAQEWFLSGDQRHRATFNGIWEVGYGFQLSGLYLYGDNGKETPTSGVDVLGIGGGAPPGVGRLNPDRTLIPRNSFDQSDFHRVDLRVQRRFALGGRVSIDGILEVFNVFNHENYGSFVTNRSNRRYGQPQAVSNIAYEPRMMQLGFRATF